MVELRVMLMEALVEVVQLFKIPIVVVVAAVVTAAEGEANMLLIQE